MPCQALHRLVPTCFYITLAIAVPGPSSRPPQHEHLLENFRQLINVLPLLLTMGVLRGAWPP